MNVHLEDPCLIVFLSTTIDGAFCPNSALISSVVLHVAYRYGPKAAIPQVTVGAVLHSVARSSSRTGTTDKEEYLGQRWNVLRKDGNSC